MGTKIVASLAACGMTPAFPPNLIIQWTKVRWTGVAHHWRRSRGNM